ncbi:MAG: hypothetical protein AB8I08_06625 [Sandaracinaceae bacterium]
MLRRLLVLAALLVLVGCDSDPQPDAGLGFDAGLRDAGRTDAGGRDAGPNEDAGTDEDSGVTDAGASDSGPSDAGPGDAGTVDSGPFDGGPDSCWEAAVTTIGSAVATGNTTGGTNDITSPECDGLGPDAQILFTAPEDGSYAFVARSDDFDPSISLHRASCSLLSEFACADDTGEERDATASAFLEAGDEIIVNVDGLGVDDSGEWALDVSRIPDTCPDVDLGMVVPSSPIAGEITVASGDNRHAPCAIGGGGRDVSYRFTAAAAGSYNFDLTVLPEVPDGEPISWAPVLYTIEDECAGRLGVCMDSSSFGFDASVGATLDAGESVIVVVEGQTVTDLGMFRLAIGGPF